MHADHGYSLHDDSSCDVPKLLADNSLAARLVLAALVHTRTGLTLLSAGSSLLKFKARVYSNFAVRLGDAITVPEVNARPRFMRCGHNLILSSVEYFSRMSRRMLFMCCSAVSGQDQVLSTYLMNADEGRV